MIERQRNYSPFSSRRESRISAKRWWYFKRRTVDFFFIPSSSAREGED